MAQNHVFWHVSGRRSLFVNSSELKLVLGWLGHLPGRCGMDVLGPREVIRGKSTLETSLEVDK